MGTEIKKREGGRRLFKEEIGPELAEESACEDVYNTGMVDWVEGHAPGEERPRGANEIYKRPCQKPTACQFLLHQAGITGGDKQLTQSRRLT